MSSRYRLVARNRNFRLKETNRFPSSQVTGPGVSQSFTEIQYMTPYVRSRIKKGRSYIPFLPDVLYSAFDALGERFESYIVGGYIRDVYMGRVPNDVDLVVMSSAPENLLFFLQCYGDTRYIHQGKGFIELMVCGYKVDVSVVPEDSQITDNLKTRDFTINAMACRLGRAIRGNRFMMNPLFFIGDIDARVIRIMNIFTFRSDPILGFRAVRLATTHGFIIHPDTIEVMKGMRDIVRYSRARQMHRELLLIMLAPNIGIGWVYLQQVGWLSNIPKSLFEKQRSIMSKISDILAIQPIHGVILSHKEFDNAFGWYQSRLQGSIARRHENDEI